VQLTRGAGAAALLLPGSARADQPAARLPPHRLQALTTAGWALHTKLQRLGSSQDRSISYQLQNMRVVREACNTIGKLAAQFVQVGGARQQGRCRTVAIRCRAGALQLCWPRFGLATRAQLSRR
jgi:hypothetical protein